MPGELVGIIQPHAEAWGWVIIISAVRRALNPYAS